MEFRKTLITTLYARQQNRHKCKEQILDYVGDGEVRIIRENSIETCIFGSVHFSSVAQWCPTLCDPMNGSNQASLSITNSWRSPKLMSIESVMPSSHLILCCPLLLLPPIPPIIRDFSSESTLCMRWPKYWIFSFSISPSKEHPGQIFFRMGWLDLLCSPGDSQESSPTPQFKSIYSSVLSFLHSPTLTFIHDHWKALTRQTFVGKVMSLLFNMLSRLVITFLSRSKCLLISLLQSPPAVILEPKKVKCDTISTLSPSNSHEVMGPDAMIFVF